MSVQAYLDSIQAKTGKTVDDFRALASERGLVGYRDLMAWLKQDFGLGHGHANLVAQMIANADQLQASPEDRLAAHFTGAKARWRPVYDQLAARLRAFGDDVATSANRTYVNVERGGKKFAILQPSTADRFDVGLKLRGVEPEGRLEAAGSWNSMVTHRVRVGAAAEVDDELLGWLRRAYDAA